MTMLDQVEYRKIHLQDRVEYLRDILRTSGKDVDWRNTNVAWVREPVNFASRYGPNVIDFPRIRKIKYTYNRDYLTLDLGRGRKSGPYLIEWIEAEGFIVEAWACKRSGIYMAKDIIGMESPEGK